MEYLLRENLLEKLLDFILQDDSPIKNSEMRASMGSSYSYSQPNFGILIKICTTMIQQQDLAKKYPVS
jgi:hypothetical protein